MPARRAAVVIAFARAAAVVVIARAVAVVACAALLFAALSSCSPGDAFSSLTGGGSGANSANGAVASESPPVGMGDPDAGMPPVASGGADALSAMGDTPYGDGTRVVVSAAADVYSSPDVTSQRLTQLLFNQTAEALDTSGQWTRVAVDATTAGWTRSNNLDADWACVDGRRFHNYVVVTAREKPVMTSPRNGVVLRDVGMGTKLFVINLTDGVYEVALPGNLSGYILEDGTFMVDVGDGVKVTHGETFAQTATKMRGASFLTGGVSYLGIDSVGMALVSAAINGVSLPRDIEGQLAAGEQVDVEAVRSTASAAQSAGEDAAVIETADASGNVDASGNAGGSGETGASGNAGGAPPASGIETTDAVTDASANTATDAAADDASGSADPYAGLLQLGDALFFCKSPSDPALSDVGLYVGNGRFVHASQHSGRVQFESVGDDFFMQRLVAIRRYFDN